MIADLAALALHELYTAFDNVIIGDGTGLSIANVGSFTLPSLPTPLLFTNALHVPAMSMNLISVLTLCADNPVNVLFFYSFFRVQDFTRGSLWFASSVEKVSINGQSPSPFGHLPYFCLLQFGPRFSLFPCGIVVTVIRLYIFFVNL